MKDTKTSDNGHAAPITSRKLQKMLDSPIFYVYDHRSGRLERLDMNMSPPAWEATWGPFWVRLDLGHWGVGVHLAGGGKYAWLQIGPLAIEMGGEFS